MDQVWITEILKGIGKFFLDPIFYYSIILAVIAGMVRVKRERNDFHIRVLNPLQELSFLFPAGLLIGLLLSIITIASGFTISYSMIAILAIITIVLSLIGNFRLLSPAFTIGLSFILLFLAKQFNWNLPIVSEYPSEKSLSGFIVLLGLLLIIEGIQMNRNGTKRFSPILRNSRRGLTVGANQVKRIWLIPVFCFLPAGPLTAPFEWWPTFDFGTGSYSLILVPFIIGFQQQIQSTLPQLAVKRVGKQVLLLGFLVSAIAAAGMWLPILSIGAIFVALVGRGWISYQHRVRENSTTYYFTPQKNGLMVLAVIPHTPAEKLGLEIGEIIHKCNGYVVHDKDEFYKALQKNRAYCKLEIFNTDGEVRFVQGALFEGDHHELGILTVEAKKNWDGNEAS
ncbi:PDZ domain-containing protein [Heyndrickxia sp. NPDC080065]|uniref:PDZ domain-containing protein n=1 Tax=Heyndrickxia sp. NPDC080065 TaxID=3390568 RepID=UPI003D0523AE